MAKMLLSPKDTDWNHFWSLEKTNPFTQESWSKRRIKNILKEYMIAGNKACDAGCGSGFFAEYFASMGMKTTAVDYSMEALKITRARSANRIDVIQADLSSPTLLKQIPERFDIIFSDGLFEHFVQADQNKIMTNFAGLLAEGGVIVTFVPNQWSPWEIIRPFYMPGIEEKPFILKQLVQLNEHNGLHVIKKGGLNTAPFKISPDRALGKYFGMLLYTVSKKT